MFTNGPFGYSLLSIGIGAILICLLAPTAGSMQMQEVFYASTESNGMQRESGNLAKSLPEKNFLSKNAPRTPISPARKLEANKITSLFVRVNDSKRIRRDFAAGVVRPPSANYAALIAG